MLHGRESLVRLVGKRRRYFFSPLARRLRFQDGSDAGEAKNVNSKKEHEQVLNGEQGWDTSVAELVSCPVCSLSVRGDDFSLNSHLDACLARGKKRKLSQRTLLQVNFLSSSSGATCLVESSNLNANLSENKHSVDIHGSHFCCPVFCMPCNNHEGCELAESKDSVLYNSDFGSRTYLPEKMNEISVKDRTVDQKISSIFPSSIMSPRNDSCQDKGDKLVYSLETVIVGRRFHEKIDLQCGAKVHTLREPQNAKDDNAIKVFCEDKGCKYSLGYLPRKLAMYLSRLIDNYHLKCEGSVLSLPEHPLAAVPIILYCKKEVQHGEIISECQQDFDSLWQQVLYENASTNSKPTSVNKYQQNFCLMLEEVMHSHSHIFTSEEKKLIESFPSLTGDAQRLLIRLYTRKGPWFRLSNISYKEISDLNAAIKELRIMGYFCSLGHGVQSFDYDMKEVLDVLTVSELQQISSQGISKNGINPVRRQELVEYILSANKNKTCLLQRVILECVGTCVKISSEVVAILWRIQRLFFLNGEQDLSSFLLVDIGLIKFPDYTCTVSKPIFKCRADLLSYEEAIEVAQIMDESIDESDMEMTRRCVGISNDLMIAYISQFQSSDFGAQWDFFSYFSAMWVYSKVLSLGVSIFEREHRYDDATCLLRELLKRIMCDSRRGYWTLRLSVDLEHLGHFNESLSVAEKGVEDPWIRAGSKMALQRRVLRLGKPPRRWKLPSYVESVKRKIKEVSIRGRPLNNETGAKSLFYGTDNELCGVEQLALQYYAKEGGGWQGVHSESSIWMTIFGLLFWDVIFSDVPDVFRSKFQVAPLDLLTDDFYTVRKSAIESQLEKIRQGMAEEILIASWQLHEGTACHGVTWDRFPLSNLRAAVSCIGGRSLASFCRHLAMDYSSWSSGMPDLLLWRFRGGDMEGGEAKLVEVKGPRDRLSEQQRAWILMLMDCGFETEVCKVSPSPKSQH